MSNAPRNWKAECRHVSYAGGEWARDQFLQWEVRGIDEPPGRGNFYQDDALLIAAAPDLLQALQELRKSFIGTYANDSRSDDEIELHREAAETLAIAAIAKATGEAS